MELSAKGLSLCYEGKEVVHQLDAGVREGKITALIGANGSGKSTLLKGFARLLKPSAGEVLLFNEPLAAYDTKEIARHLSLLPQNPQAPIGINVFELVCFGRYPYLKRYKNDLTKDDYIKVEEAMKLTGTWEFRYRDINALSGGQRQRAWIALTLAQDSKILLLDEPTTFLDLTHQLEILKLLKKLNQEFKKTIVLVIHDLNQAARFADDLICLKSGEILYRGEVRDVFTSEMLRDVFQIDAKIVLDPRSSRPAFLSYDQVEKA
ncbi:MAG: ABC transporter ATP-binding protein [Lacrimispora celerecrescens]|nr:ABC transporter ATP-binding protein [Lacrimispora celerecrescens]